MTYDDILKSLGGFGKYQFKVYFLLCLPAIICAFHKLVGVFLQITPAFRCRLANELANSSYSLPEHVWHENYPWDQKTSNYSTCTYYSSNQTIEYCDSYIYDTRDFKNTVVTDWNLVCDRAYYVDAANSVFMSGVMIGSIFFGQMSDQYGRKITFFVSLVIEVVFGILTALSPDIITYNITRFVVGATTSGVFLVAYVIALEMVGPEKRLVAGVVIQMFFSFGYVMLVPFAYFISEWRQLQLTLTLIGVLFFPYWWQIPESVRWLLTKQKIGEAKEIVATIAKTNNVHFNTDTMDSFIVKESEFKTDDKVAKEATLMDIFKKPNLRKKAIIIFFNWFVNSGTYYGLAYNTSIIQQNVFTNFFLAGFVEFPAYTMLLFLLNRWGRRKTLSMFMLVAGLSLISIIFVPSENKLLITILVMTGKLAITSSYGTIYIFTVEQFPTVIRNVALGAASTFAKAGSIVAPLVNILGQIWIPLPMVVFGSVALVGGLLSLALPETLNKQLPETIEDAESFGKKRNTRK